MKSELLILSCALVSVMKTDASQEHGGVIAHHSPAHLRSLHDTPYKPQDTSNTLRSSENKEVISTSTDPFELAEMSDEYFGKGDYKKAANFFISSAIHGNSDNKAALAEIAAGSSKYLNSPQSTEANQYFETHLTPKLIEYFKLRTAELKKHKDKPVIMYKGQ